MGVPHRGLQYTAATLAGANDITANTHTRALLASRQQQQQSVVFVRFFGMFV